MLPRLSVGVRSMLVAAFFFSIMAVFVKATSRHLPVLEVMLFRCLLSLVMGWFWLRRSGISPWGNRRRMLLARGFIGTGALFCFFYSISQLPLAEATVIQNAAPIFTALLAVWLLRERIDRFLALSLVLSFSGVLLVARPMHFLTGTHEHAVAVACALFGSLCSGFAYVSVRQLGKTEDPLVIVFYFPLVATPILLPLAALVWVWPSPVEWLCLCGMALATQTAQVFMTRALAAEHAGRTLSAGYVQILLSALWGFALFDELPSETTGLGALLIVIGTMALARRERE